MTNHAHEGFQAVLSAAQQGLVAAQHVAGRMEAGSFAQQRSLRDLDRVEALFSHADYLKTAYSDRVDILENLVVIASRQVSNLIGSLLQEKIISQEDHDAWLSALPKWDKPPTLME